MVTIHPMGERVMVVRYVPLALPVLLTLGGLLLLGNATSLQSIHPRWTLLSLPVAADHENPSVDFGWQDVQVREGIAEFCMATPQNSEIAQFDDFLLISSLGTAADRSTVRICCESQGLTRADTATWTPLPRHSGSEPSLTKALASRFEPRDCRVSPVSTGTQIDDLDAERRSVRTLEFARISGGAWSPNAIETLRCEVTWSSPTCRIWRVSDEPCDARSLAWAQQVGRLCTDHVRPAVHQLWGSWPDVDGDGVLNLLITERVLGMGDNVQAFVRPQDFQARGDSEWTQPWDVIYLRPGQNLADMEAILQHEMTHVAQFSWCRHLCGNQRWPLPDWITEGLAHATEIRLAGGVCSTNLEDRLEAFAACPARTPLVVVDAAASRLWRDPAQRGASAAFCHWWQQNSGFYRWPEIIHAFQETEDPWNQFSGQSFAEIYRQWTLSVLLDGIPSQQPGLNGKPQIVSLKPGQSTSHVIAGTATLYVKLNALNDHSSSGNTTEWNISVDCDRGTPLQITRVRVPRRRTAMDPLAARSDTTIAR